MGGAGAGAGVFLFVPLLHGAPFFWLIAALTAWILVLPRWTCATVMLSVASCGPLAFLYLEGGQTTLGKAFALLNLGFAVSGILAIPATIALRILIVILAIRARKR